MCEILEIIKSRRSTRKFKEVPVEQEKVAQIIEAGTYAPSGGNSQNWVFFVVYTKEKLAELAGIVEKELAEMTYDEHTYTSLKNAIQRAKKGGFAFHYNAPCLIIVANRKTYPNAMADSACALQNMMLMANSLDLGSCWINQLHWLEEHEVIREYLRPYGLTDELTICGSLAVGYANTEDGLPVRMPLERKSIPVLYI